MYTQYIQCYNIVEFEAKSSSYMVDTKCTKSWLHRLECRHGIEHDTKAHHLCYVVLLTLCYNLQNVQSPYLSYSLRYKDLRKWPTDRFQL